MDSLLFLAKEAQASGFAEMFGQPNWVQIITGVIGGGLLAGAGGALVNVILNRMAEPQTIGEVAPNSMDSRRWEALPVLIGKLTEASEPNQVFRVILETTKEYLSCEYCALLILRGNEYRYEAGIGLCEESRQAFKLPAADGLVDFMRTKGQSVILTRNDRQLQTFKFLREPISEVIVTPLRTGSNIFALLFVANKAQLGTFNKADFEMLSVISMPFALSLFQAITFKRAQGSVVSAIVDIITNDEETSPYSKGHSKRVAAMAEAMGRELRMSALEIDSLRSAAYLHDLGKFSLPDNLRFCEALPDNPQERDMVAQQDKVAVSWLRPLGFVEKSLPLILHHHERYDGSGFPANMRGAAIPIGAMIIAVAETFDLMTHPHPNHKARSAEEVKEYIESQSNSKFDPQVVRAFISVMNKSAAG